MTGSSWLKLTKSDTRAWFCSSAVAIMVHYADAKLFGQGQANTNDFRVDWNCAVRMIGSAMSDKTPVGAVNLRLGGGDDDVKLNSDILHVTC